MTRIDEYAFSCCNGLTSIHSNALNPPVVEGAAFLRDYYDSHLSSGNDIIYKNVTLYVPKGCLDKYKNANDWERFSNIEEEVL